VRFSPGCRCCAPAVTPACGSVCSSAQNFCTNAPEPGVAISVDRWSVTGLTQNSGGTGYGPNGTNKALTFSGVSGASGAAGLYDIVNGSIANPRLTGGGSGYVTAPAVGFAGLTTFGSGASVTAAVAGVTVGICTTTGQLSSVSVSNPTVNGPYNNQPNILITGDGTGATATAVRTGGVVGATLTLTNPGGGFSAVPSVAITDPAGSGSGAAATARMGVDTAVLTAGGTGYAVNDVLTVAGGTAFTTSTLTVTSVSGGVITAVSVSRAGAYTVLPASPVAVTGGLGTGARFNLTWKVAQLILGTGGSLYVSPTVSFSGGAPTTPATATATASVIRVNSITVTANGSGYTTATAAVDPPASGTTALATATVGAQCCAPITQGGNLTVTASRGGRMATVSLANVLCTGSSTVTTAVLRPYKTIGTLFGTASGGLLGGPVTFSVPFTGTQGSPQWTAGFGLPAGLTLALPSRVVQCSDHSQGAGTALYFVITVSCQGGGLVVGLSYMMNWENSIPPSAWTQPASGTIGNVAICFGDAANACRPEDPSNGSPFNLAADAIWVSSVNQGASGIRSTTVIDKASALFAATTTVNDLVIDSCTRRLSTNYSNVAGYVSAANPIPVPFTRIDWSE
jgi:hypothetical protein